MKEDAQKQHLLLAMIGGCTFKLLASLVEKPGEEDYPEILRVLEEHLKPKLIKIAERFRFYKQNQLPAEIVAIYLAELRRLASTCESE